MRRIWLSVLVVCALALPAGASRVVVMTAPELGEDLEVVLAGRRVAIAWSASPAGALRLDRAAAAQRAAVDAQASAAVWLDESERDAGMVDVCAVSADGRYFRHAPLPRDEASPRVFAAIATSLLDELLAPPEGISVDVRVDVNVNGAASTAPVVAVAPPGQAVAHLAPLAPPGAYAVVAPVPRRNAALFEVGPMASPVTIGVEANLLMPVSSSWRFGVMGVANVTVVDETLPILGAGLELRRTGRGDRRHFDLGFVGGVASVMEGGDSNETVGFAGVRLNWTWEGAQRSTALSVSPIAVFTGEEGDPVIPGIWASLRWGFGL
jgi:hypothetical protein